MKMTQVLLIAVAVLLAGTSFANTNRALVLVESQNEWLADDGKLRNLLVKDKEQFNVSVINSKQVLQAARDKGIHVTMSPDSRYQIFGAGKYGVRAVIPKVKTWQGKMKEIHPDFKPVSGEYVIRDRSGVSGFAGTSLDSYLRNNDIKDIFIMGYALHVCVESTMRDAHDLGYNASVILDSSAAFTREQKVFFEKNILHHFGHGIRTAEFLSME